MPVKEQVQQAIHEGGKLRRHDPLDRIEKDPNFHYIIADSGVKPYRGYSDQVEYFKTVDYEIVQLPKGILQASTQKCMRLPKALYDAALARIPAEQEQQSSFEVGGEARVVTDETTYSNTTLGGVLESFNE